MRRTLTDALSRPVRNQCTNPRWETTGASSIIRTNLCTNPGVEAVGGTAVTVRTNWSTRPRMVDTSLGGYGSQTLTAVTGLSGHPDNITTAVRVSYTAGAANPGAMISNTPSASTAHTVSAWVYNEGAATENIALAMQGIASGGSVPVAPATWTRLTWVNYVTPASPAAFGARISTPSAAGSFLVTGIMIETSAFDTGYFFDGNSVTRPDGGSLTYSWTGTSGLSASLQRGVSCPSYAAANQGILYRSGTPGTALAARVHFTNNTIMDSGIALGLAFPGVLPSKTYTLSCDVTTDRDRAVKLSIQGAGTVMTSAGFTHAAGVTVRRSITFQTNSSATSANVALYLLRNDLLMGTIDMDNVLIEEAGYAGTYFDGSTAATADFTFSWASTANASISRLSAIAVAAASVNTTGTGNKHTYMCSDRPAVHGKFVRMVIDTTNSVGLNTTDTVMPAGYKRTNLFWLRTSRAMGIQVRYRSTDGASVSNGPIINTAANEWQLWRVSDKPSVADNQHLSLLIAAPGTAIGDVVDLGPRMVVEGDYQGDYLDGTRALAKWVGAADASESIGYPPQLTDIAGAPVIDMTGTAGTIVPLPGGFAPDEARTFYTVYQALAEPGAGVHVMVSYGEADLNDSPSYSTLQLRTQGAPLQLLNRRTAGQGALVPGIPWPAINVACWGINASGIQFGQNNNGTVFSGGSQVMATPHEAIRLHTANAYQIHVRTIMFRGYHDATTRASINRYLANRHGAYAL